MNTPTDVSRQPVARFTGTVFGLLSIIGLMLLATLVLNAICQNKSEMRCYIRFATSWGFSLIIYNYVVRHFRKTYIFLSILAVWALNLALMVIKDTIQ